MENCPADRGPGAGPGCPHPRWCLLCAPPGLGAGPPFQGDPLSLDVRLLFIAYSFRSIPPHGIVIAGGQKPAQVLRTGHASVSEHPGTVPRRIPQ